MAGYWFARRFPVGHPRKAMAPVAPAGWFVAVAFLAAMAAGGLAFILLALGGMPIWGVALFVAVAVVAGGAFIAIAYRKGDRQRTVEDYRKLSGEGPAR